MSRPDVTCCHCGYGHPSEDDCVPKLRAELHAAREMAWEGWSRKEQYKNIILEILERLKDKLKGEIRLYEDIH